MPVNFLIINNKAVIKKSFVDKKFSEVETRVGAAAARPWQSKAELGRTWQQWVGFMNLRSYLE